MLAGTVEVSVAASTRTRFLTLNAPEVPPLHCLNCNLRLPQLHLCCTPALQGSASLIKVSKMRFSS